MMLGELRGVSAFVTHVLGLHCALPSIVALRALGRVLRRVILSEMNEGRSACGFDTQDRLLLSFPAHTKALRASKLKEQF